MAYRNQKTLTPAVPVVLTIRRQQYELIFDLSEIEPLIQNTNVLFDEKLFASLIAELETLTESFNLSLIQSGGSPIEKESLAAEITPRFKKLGRIIHEQLFPDPIKKVLAERADENLFLRMGENLLEIPWELSFDGKEFLFRRFRIGRQVITSQPFSRPQGTATSDRIPSRLLIVCDPTESLPAAVEETETLLEILDQEESIKVEVLGGQHATKLEVLAALSEFDLIHFAGHSVFQPSNSKESGWLLHDGILTTEEMSKISNPPLLVFSNSCVSAQTSRWDVLNSLGQAPLGIGGSFLMAGVRHTIGALWVIHDRSSAQFAGRFYSHLFACKTIGEALFVAKGDDAAGLDAAHLFGAGYVHYGKPDDRLFHPIESEHDWEDEPGFNISGSPVASAKRRNKLTSPMVAPLLVFVLVSVAMLVFIYGARLLNDSRSLSPLLTAYEKALEDYQKGRIPAAISAFQNLTKRKDNSSYLGYGDLAEIYLEAGATDKAKEILKQALGKPLCNSLTFVIEGDLAMQEGDAVGSEAAYQKALLMDSSPPYQAARALNALGILSFLTGDQEHAMDFFTRALAKEDKCIDARFNLGVMAYLRNDMEKAADLVSAVGPRSSQEELATLFLENILANAIEEDSNAPPPAGGKTLLLVGPFYLKGGTVKRLGYDLVLARLLRQRLATTEMGRGYPLKEADCADFVRRVPGPPGIDPRDQGFLGYIRSYGAKIAICGNLLIYPHVFYANVKVVDAASGAVVRALDARTEDPGKIRKMAEKLGDELKTIGRL